MQVREVGDGNINYVWAVTGPSGSMCLKQGPPYVRVASSWALSQVITSPPVRLGNARTTSCRHLALMTQLSQHT